MSYQSSILSMFVRSPIRPLQLHMEAALASAKLLNPYFEAVIAKKWSEAESLQQQISEKEQEADTLKMELRTNLTKKLFLPVSRSAMFELLSQQELIANLSKDIAGIVLGRKMEIPEPIRDLFTRYLNCSIDATAQSEKAINELDELFESGFRGKEVELVEKMLSSLDAIERETDQIQMDLRAKLFELEKSLPPVDVIFLYKIIEWVGELADLAQKVGRRLQVLMAD